MVEKAGPDAERAALLRTLELERSRLASVFQQAPALVAVLRGPEHVFEMANPAYLRLIGLADVVGKPVRYVLPELAEQGYVALLDRVRETGEPFVGTEMPALLRFEPGAALEERFFNFVYQPLLDADGAVSGIFAHGVDVTDLVNARRTAEEQAAEMEALNDELVRANADLAVQAAEADRVRAEADRANRAKSEFLAVMSHELRTPLNAIIGYTDLLLAGIPDPIPRGAERKVERIGLSGRHLLSLIEEILTFSRLEAGEERVDAAEVVVGRLVEEVQALTEPLALAKGIGFECRAPSADLVLRTDERKVRQVLLNLLGNAIKFTEEGGVTLEVAEAGDEVLFRVSDTGPGIAPEHLDRIFTPFWQAESGSTRTVGGTGLGLTVTRRLAHLLGGEVTVASEPGRGSTFTLHLPVSAPVPGASDGEA